MDSMIEADRYCKVCGDKAVYVNYGALTCDSCKTFFRRQNLHPKNLTCNYNGRCLINAKTRKDCTKCRLIKCFAIGMRSDVIGSATSERQRKNSLARSGTMLNGQSLAHDGFYGSHPGHGEEYPFFTNHDQSNFVASTGIAGSDSNSCSSDEGPRRRLNSLYHDQMDERRQEAASDYDRSFSGLDFVDKECPMPCGTSLKVQEYQDSLLPLNHITTGYCHLRNLNPAEVLHIEAVKDAAAAIRSRVFMTDDAKCTKPVLAAMKLQSFGVDKLISGMARIEAFSHLNDKLKATLLKGAVAEMMLVRSTMHFDPLIKGWTINAVDIPGNNQTSFICDKLPAQPQTQNVPIVPCSSQQSSHPSLLNVSFHLSIELFKHIPGATEWVEDYFKFCSLLDQSWKEDEVLITLLMVLILFNPENVDPGQIKEIKYQQTYFQFMLKRYLETSCDTLGESAAAFDRLKQARKLVRRLKNSFESTVLNLNPEDICSLNPANLTDQVKDKPNNTETVSIITSPNRIHENLMIERKVEQDSRKMNPFGPRAVVSYTNPSGFWKNSSHPTNLEQCLRNPNPQEDVVKIG